MIRKYFFLQLKSGYTVIVNKTFLSASLNIMELLANWLSS